MFFLVACSTREESLQKDDLLKKLDTLDMSIALQDLSTQMYNDSLLSDSLVKRYATPEIAEHYPNFVGYLIVVAATPQKGQYNKMLSDKLELLATTTNKAELYAWRTYMQARAIQNEGKYAIATDKLLEVLQYFEKTHNIKGMQLIYKRLGYIYQDALNDYDKALLYSRKAYALITDTVELGPIYYSFVKGFSDKKEYDSVEYYLKKHAEIFGDNTMFYLSQKCFSETWQAIEGNGHLDSLRKYSYRFLNELKSEKHGGSDTLMMIYTNALLTEAYVRMGQYGEARQRFSEGVILSDQHQELLKERMYIYCAGAELFDSLKQYDVALKYSKEYRKIYDEIKDDSTQTSVNKAIDQFTYKQEKIELRHQQELTNEKLEFQKKQNIYIGIGFVFVLLGGVYLYQSLHKQRIATKTISSQKEIISIEKHRSEELLLNILPADIAGELKEKGSAQAKLYNDVTVLFTDFKNFTNASEQLTPQELVDELHSCFKVFDEIINKYKIEKIKTIGDAYLAVCGLPLADEHHAERMVHAAIEIRDFMKQRRTELGEKTFEIRIGINSGSVVAGIVGVKKFAYDIWGDTVNTAARMEQNSKAGRINISQSTYDLVKDKFACEYRGGVEAKNKGILKMYFVESITTTSVE